MSEDSLNFNEEVVDDISKEHEGLAEFTRVLLTRTCIIHDYFSLYVCKSPCMTSSQTGDKWVCELLHGHPTRFHNIFRMSQVIFMDILSLLESSYGLHGSRRTTSREVLAITLYILGHNESIRSTCERFQHSTEIISRLFYNGLQALVRLGMENIAPIYKFFHDTPPQIMNDARYMPYFKDCIGVIDSTHVIARIPVEEQVACIGRYYLPTQNVMAACDFNMCFTFVAPGCYNFLFYQYRIRVEVEESNTMEAEVDFNDGQGVHEMVELRDRIAFELCN